MIGRRETDEQGLVTPSPWYCPECELWIGKKLPECKAGHSPPLRPLLWDHVEKPAFRVTLGDRLRAKVGWYDV
ncbi:hypothetical protein GWK26_11930 [haloarchaeon 3A1-DGR]|nr:hypothetical protein GWK26_11930 [haloarchaeon 3A1-DGR]